MLRQQAHANAVNSYTDHLNRPFGGKRASVGQCVSRLILRQSVWLKCAIYSNTRQKDTSRLS